MKVPRPDEITADFLTACLRDAGHAGVRVSGFTQSGIGTGQMGRCIRYELELESAEPDAPRSLVAKFPSDEESSRQTALLLRNYVKEVAFYQQLQPRLTVRTPRCYHASIDGEGPEFLLLLEDLAPARQGDQLAGCSPAVAHAAVQELVGLHAPSWCDAALAKLDWLGAPDALIAQAVRALYQFQLPAFLDRFRERLEPDEVAIIERVAESEGPPFEPLPHPFSLIHVDYRLDNLMIDESLEPPSITVVDWQSLALGSPLSDVAYFLGAGLLTDERREAERGIVESYHRGLLAAGVTDYGFQRCWEDYRRGTFAGFAVTVVAAPMVQRTERGDEMFTAMARRHARHALDLGSAEFLRPR